MLVAPALGNATYMVSYHGHATHMVMVTQHSSDCCGYCLVTPSVTGVKRGTLKSGQELLPPFDIFIKNIEVFKF